jgi:hypothetical protein
MRTRLEELLPELKAVNSRDLGYLCQDQVSGAAATGASAVLGRFHLSAARQVRCDVIGGLTVGESKVSNVPILISVCALRVCELRENASCLLGWVRGTRTHSREILAPISSGPHPALAFLVAIVARAAAGLGSHILVRTDPVEKHLSRRGTISIRQGIGFPFFKAGERDSLKTVTAHASPISDLDVPDESSPHKTQKM